MTHARAGAAGALPPDAAALARAWSAAAWAPALDAGLRALYEEAAQEVALRRPLCLASGQCCRFEAHGHRLYVTGLEAAWCLRGLGRAPTPAELAGAHARGDCPFLDGARCGAHPWRPLGCRAYYCDGAAQGWQQELSERLLARVRALHDAHEVPYRYGEWRQMLAYFAADGATS